MRRRALLTTVTVALAMTAHVSGARAAGPAPATAPKPDSGARGFRVQGSVEQLAVLDAPAGATARLVGEAGATVARRTIDAQGATVFRRVEPGPGYRVEIGRRRSEPVDVASPDAVPDPSLYSSQPLEAGFGYITTRDGTLLSANVSLPGPIEDGPYPTLVEYSGYDPSNPSGLQPASAIAQILGYATVGVNVRGSGCSGGSWDYFETLQSLDGYDAVETVAAQPWVAHGKVGMAGISYPGITQLFVAATRPPHLAAIAPLSVLDDTYETLYPGGILNNGFALRWGTDRQRDAEPAASAWVEERIARGDTTCEANQALRLQTPDVGREIRRLGATRGTPAADALVPATFVDRIEVPVFVAGSWQDEETGGHFAEMLDDFAPGTVVKATLMNGRHADSLGPEVLTRWAEFLDFYIARRVPRISPTIQLLAGAVLLSQFGSAVTLPPDRFDAAADYATTLAAYEAEPSVRVLFDNGAGGPPLAPLAGFEAVLPSWPPPATTTTTWHFAPHGRLATAAPAAAGRDTFAYDPAAFPRTDVGGWSPLPRGKAVAYVTEPLASDTVVLGSGSVDLWLRSTAPDVDIEVTVSEVHPDGKETYVQSGWLRASRRLLDEETSTELRPVPTYRRRDAVELPEGVPSLVRVPLFPMGHAFREGSRLRIAVQPPGGNRPLWAFDALTYGKRVTNTIERSRRHPSRVVLPVAAGIDVTTPRPACDSLRGQPCRDYVPSSNGADR